MQLREHQLCSREARRFCISWTLVSFIRRFPGTGGFRHALVLETPELLLTVGNPKGCAATPWRRRQGRGTDLDGGCQCISNWHQIGVKYFLQLSGLQESACVCLLGVPGPWYCLVARLWLACWLWNLDTSCIASAWKCLLGVPEFICVHVCERVPARCARALGAVWWPWQR